MELNLVRLVLDASEPGELSFTVKVVGPPPLTSDLLARLAEVGGALGTGGLGTLASVLGGLSSAPSQVLVGLRPLLPVSPEHLGDAARVSLVLSEGEVAQVPFKFLTRLLSSDELQVVEGVVEVTGAPRR